MRERIPCNKFASIEILQTSPHGATLTIGDGLARLELGPKVIAEWPSRHVAVLTVDLARAPGLVGHLVFAEEATPEALSALRDAGISYATSAEEWFLISEPTVLYVNPPRRQKSPTTRVKAVRLSRAAVRGAKWLLLNPEAVPSVGQLAEGAGSSIATMSRAVQELAARRLVVVRVDGADSRRRAVYVRDSNRLLDVLAEDEMSRTLRTVTWDVGERAAADAVARVADSSGDLPYAIGELAGVHLVNPSVEASHVVLWVAATDIQAWAERLYAEPAAPGPGRVTTRVARDPWMFTVATPAAGVHVADPVQLFLDCRSAGERALEAAQLMRHRIVPS